jgi:hypothetical protein
MRTFRTLVSDALAVVRGLPGGVGTVLTVVWTVLTVVWNSLTAVWNVPT